MRPSGSEQQRHASSTTARRHEIGKRCKIAKEHFFFSCKSGPLSQLGDRLTAYRVLQCCSCASTRAHARSGKRLGPAGAASSSTRSSGGASRWCGCSGAGQARPSAVVATACCTATLSMPHQRRVQPARAAGRRAGGARCARTRSKSRKKRWASVFQRPPTSEPSTTSCCGPPWLSSG